LGRPERASPTSGPRWVARRPSAGLKACATFNTFATFAIALAFGALATAQDSWPTYHGDYSGQRHSRLTQTTLANVHQLTLAWAFQTGQTQQIKSTPIVVDGVIYVTTPDNIWALDARSARQLWRYTYPAIRAFTSATAAAPCTRTSST